MGKPEGEAAPVEPLAGNEEDVKLEPEGKARPGEGPTKEGEASVFSGVEEQLRFQAGLLDAVGQAVTATDLEGRILFWNRAAEELYGWSRDAVLGRSVYDLGLTPDRRELAEEIMATVARGESWSGEVEAAPPHADPVPAFLVVTPVRDADDTLVGAVGISTDLTPWRGMERKLQEAQRLEAVGRMAAGVAQGFNNSLTAIEGYADLLRSRLSDDSEARWDLRALLGAARRARELTSQLLAFSRRQVLKPQAVDLCRHLKGRRAMLEALVGKDASMEFALDATARRVSVDPSRFDQVLVHLTLNALEAMPGGGLIRVEVDEVEAGAVEPDPDADANADRYGVVVIRDEGEGIPRDLRHRIFEPFFTTRQDKGASGLGLSTVYGIVSQSGGWVDVSSEEGEGTEIRVYLPAADSPPSESPAEASSSA